MCRSVSYGCFACKRFFGSPGLSTSQGLDENFRQVSTAKATERGVRRTDHASAIRAVPIPARSTGEGRLHVDIAKGQLKVRSPCGLEATVEMCNRPKSRVENAKGGNMKKWMSVGLLVALALLVYGQKKEEERVDNAGKVMQ